jgi:hypothetical protein
MEFDMRQNLGEVGSGLDDNLGGSLKRVGEYILFLCFILLYSSFSNASILCSFCKCLCRTIAPKQTSVTAETEKHFNMAHTPRHCNRGRSLYGENDGDVEVKEGGHTASTIKETTRRGSWWWRRMAAKGGRGKLVAAILIDTYFISLRYFLVFLLTEN